MNLTHWKGDGIGFHGWNGGFKGPWGPVFSSLSAPPFLACGFCPQGHGTAAYFQAQSTTSRQEGGRGIGKKI